MCDNPVKDIQKAKARLVPLFGDLVVDSVSIYPIFIRGRTV